MRGQRSRSSPGVRRGFEGGQMSLYRRIRKLRGIAGGYRSLDIQILSCRCFLAVEILLGPGSATSENTQKKFLDVKRLSLQVRESLEELQSKVDKSRLAVMGVFIELEKERMEEELDIARRKVLRLQAQKDGSSVVDQLWQELREYREIVKCNTCLDPPKEVVITKFYHLFCNPCVQRITESHHRKFPVCAASFGPNDANPVYIRLEIG